MLRKFELELQNDKAQKCLKMLKDLEKKCGDVAILSASKDLNLSHVIVILKALKE